MKNGKQLVGYTFLSVFICIIDRCTKMAALAWCNGQFDDNVSLLSCYVTLNRGVAWGVFDSKNASIFCAVSSVIVLITAFFAYYAYKRFKDGYSVFGEVCIVAGSCSNIIDRFYYNGVVDFILLSYYDFSFPVFNMADVAIVCGVCIIIGQQYWSQDT